MANSVLSIVCYVVPSAILAMSMYTLGRDLEKSRIQRNIWNRDRVMRDAWDFFDVQEITLAYNYEAMEKKKRWPSLEECLK